MKLVIIGNSAAAVGCIEGLRKFNQDIEITVISDEPYHTYSRPLISYLLYGKTTEDKMKYRPDSFYTDNKVEFVQGEVTDIKNGVVTLKDGKTFPYDKLFVGTGSKPFVPPMEGLEKTKNFTFMTLDSAKELEKAVNKDSEVLVIGAGLIGLKCVEGLYDRVKHITVIDLADRILPSILDTKGSEIMQKYLEDKGITIKTGVSAKSFESNSAVLSDDSTLKFDVVVVAVGVRPNTELVKDAGGNVNKGIVVDEFCQTSLPNVYAGGDCTESFDISSDSQKILALLPNAYMQGETAGMHIAGIQKLYNKAIPMNAIGFFGYHIGTAGSYDGFSAVSVDGENYRNFFIKDNVLKGYILIGDLTRAGIYTNMIREKTPINTVDWLYLKDEPSLTAFSKEYRKEILAK
ncbi:MAG: FAD-dependent oxidoreductase [Oscillospiraceae bacterium]|jgi:NAD(P)H-nitrite reductase large subunit|nr:FAD-dependent oxidoreductase [Oscillospiraceae bacterium]